MHSTRLCPLELNYCLFYISKIEAKTSWMNETCPGLSGPIKELLKLLLSLELIQKWIHGWMVMVW